MKRFLLWAVLALTPALGFSGLNDFKDDVEKTEKENAEKRKQEDQRNKQNSQDSNNNSSGDPCSQACGAMIGEICGSMLSSLCSATAGPLFAAWGGHLGNTNYGDFPYGDHGFIQLPKWESQKDKETPEYTVTGVRDYWYSLETQGVYMNGLGGGFGVTIKGAFIRPLGPYLEMLSLFDGQTNLTSIRPGLALALVQTDPFSLYTYGQFIAWTGVMTRMGATVGLEMRSYPAKPLALRLRGGMQLFGYFSIFEGEAEAGVMLSSVEILGGWRLWMITGQPLSETPYNGPFGGIKIHL